METSALPFLGWNYPPSFESQSQSHSSHIVKEGEEEWRFTKNMKGESRAAATDATRGEHLVSQRLLVAATLVLPLSCAGVPLAFKVDSYPLLFISIGGIIMSTHALSLVRVARKYQRIALHIPGIEEIGVDFWNTECSIKVKGKSPVYVFYLATSPYGSWIMISHGIPAGETLPEHYQVWKAALWWEEHVSMNPYDFDRYLDPGRLGNSMAP